MPATHEAGVRVGDVLVRVGARELVDAAIAKKELMLMKVRELFEVNPMLGHRGVRLGITYPEIYAMQIRAVLEAVARGLERDPKTVPPVQRGQEVFHES